MAVGACVRAAPFYYSFKYSLVPIKLRLFNVYNSIKTFPVKLCNHLNFSSAKTTTTLSNKFFCNLICLLLFYSIESCIDFRVNLSHHWHGYLYKATLKDNVRKCCLHFLAGKGDVFQLDCSFLEDKHIGDRFVIT